MNGRKWTYSTWIKRGKMMERQFRNDAEVDLHRCAVMLKHIAASLEQLETRMDALIERQTTEKAKKKPATRKRTSKKE